MNVTEVTRRHDLAVTRHGFYGQTESSTLCERCREDRMVKKLRKPGKPTSAAVAILFVLGCFQGSVASAQGAQPAGTETGRSAGGPRKQLATIIYAGLGGAVLGLSTLSFYGRPQDKLANIAIGFAIGVIAGTSVVTYNAATNPDEFYGPNDDRQTWRYDFKRPSDRELASGAEIESSRPISMPISISYSFAF